MILVDVSKFMPIETFKSQTDRYIRSIKASRKAEGVEEILLPGELEHKRFVQYMESGYEVGEALGAELAGYAAQFGITAAGSRFEDFIGSL